MSEIMGRKEGKDVEAQPKVEAKVRSVQQEISDIGRERKWSG